MEICSPGEGASEEIGSEALVEATHTLSLGYLNKIPMFTLKLLKFQHIHRFMLTRLLTIKRRLNQEILKQTCLAASR